MLFNNSGKNIEGNLRECLIIMHQTNTLDARRHKRKEMNYFNQENAKARQAAGVGFVMCNESGLRVDCKTTLQGESCSECYIPQPFVRLELNIRALSPYFCLKLILSANWKIQQLSQQFSDGMLVLNLRSLRTVAKWYKLIHLVLFFLLLT